MKHVDRFITSYTLWGCPEISTWNLEHLGAWEFLFPKDRPGQEWEASETGLEGQCCSLGDNTWGKCLEMYGSIQQVDFKYTQMLFNAYVGLGWRVRTAVEYYWVSCPTSHQCAGLSAYRAHGLATLQAMEVQIVSGWFSAGALKRLCNFLLKLMDQLRWSVDPMHSQVLTIPTRLARWTLQ